MTERAKAEVKWLNEMHPDVKVAAITAAGKISVKADHREHRHMLWALKRAIVAELDKEIRRWR